MPRRLHIRNLAAPERRAIVRLTFLGLSDVAVPFRRIQRLICSEIRRLANQLLLIRASLLLHVAELVVLQGVRLLHAYNVHDVSPVVLRGLLLVAGLRLGLSVLRFEYDFADRCVLADHFFVEQTAAHAFKRVVGLLDFFDLLLAEFGSNVVQIARKLEVHLIHNVLFELDVGWLHETAGGRRAMVLDIVVDLVLVVVHLVSEI